MFKGNRIPQADLSRPVDEELIDEIEARVEAGWRVRTDMEIMIQYIRAKLREKDASKEEINETRCTTDRGLCKGVSCPSNGCCKGNPQVS
jgi:hypothetical protein